MESQPRVDPADNDLAATTMAAWDRVRPHLGTIAVAIAVLFVGLAGLVVVRSQRAALVAAGWDDCLIALLDRDPARLADVVRQYEKTPAALWAELLQADTALADGIRQLQVDPVRARERLAEAIALYTAVNQQRPSGVAAERGILGLALARESRGELDDAVRGYEALVAEHPESPFRALAEERIAALSRNATRRWYEWYESRTVVPAAAASAESPGGTPEKPEAGPEPPAADKPAAESPAAPAGPSPPPSAAPAAESPPSDVPAAESAAPPAG